MTGPVLVVGGAGRLGAAMVNAFADHAVITHTRESLDIADASAVCKAVSAASPAIIVNCAAFNDVDGAEDRASEALAVNAFGVRNLARAAETAGATLVHFSTDFVFDGTACEPYGEESTPSPRSTYAMTKLLGEWFALDTPGAYVLRVESLFGTSKGWTGRRGSLDTIVEGIEHGRRINVFTDRVVTPSYVPDVARATQHLMESGAAPGLYHCVNSGQTTWYELAEEVGRLLDARPQLEAVTLDTVQLKAVRPRFCALSNRKLAAAGFMMPSWQDALRRWHASRELTPR